MNEHPIIDLLEISMSNIKEMINVDVIVGKPIEFEKIIIVPISKMKCGFASGGTDQNTNKGENKFPFGGAAGGSVNITPVAFLVISDEEIKLLRLDSEDSIYEKVLDKVPEVLETIKKVMSKEDGPVITNLEVIEKK